ncbi:IS110 family transposase [Pseudomonadota bacterium]
MKTSKLIAIDLAKDIFQLAVTCSGSKVTSNKAVKRKNLLTKVLQHIGAVIVMEACGGANYWSRLFTGAGFDVVLLSPQHVKRFRAGQKNDANDVLAIITAYNEYLAGRIPRVEAKSIEQQDMQCIHRIRTQIDRNVTALGNQIRGLLAEYGIVMPKTKAALAKAVPELLEDSENGLSFKFRELLDDLNEELKRLTERLNEYTRKIKLAAHQQEAAKRLMELEGVGEITATALVASIGNGSAYQNGRQFSASIGLTPRQHSSGGISKLYGITRIGDSYLRSLLVHGARSVLSKVDKKVNPNEKSVWLINLKTRIGFNKAAVALANKTARTAWALLSTGESYRGANACH